MGVGQYQDEGDSPFSVSEDTWEYEEVPAEEQYIGASDDIVPLQLQPASTNGVFNTRNLLIGAGLLLLLYFIMRNKK